MIDRAPIGGRESAHLNACGLAKGRPGVCYFCAGELPKGRRRWCSEECRVQFEGHHYWGVARWLALREAGHQCVRCGSDGMVATSRCRCSGRWPCAKAGTPVYAWDGDDRPNRLMHEQRFDQVLEVNHIVPRNGRGYLPGCHHHQSNLEVLCRPCHVMETRRQNLGRKLARLLRAAIGVREGRLVVQPRVDPRRRSEAESVPLWEWVA